MKTLVVRVESSSSVNFLSTLTSSPSSLLGKIMFAFGAQPDKVEQQVARLGLDTAVAVLDNCCPKIPVSIEAGLLKQMTNHNT